MAYVRGVVEIIFEATCRFERTNTDDSKAVHLWWRFISKGLEFDKSLLSVYRGAFPYYEEDLSA